MTTAQVKIELTSESRLAALNDYSRRAKEAASVTGDLRAQLSGLSNLGGKLMGFSIAGVSIASLGSVIQDTLSRSSVMADEIDRASSRVGISAEGYQVLGRVLKDAGGEAGDLATALAALRNNVGEALKNPESNVAKSLAEIGLRANDLSRGAPERQLEILSQALSRIEDPARRAAIAQDLMGKGAVALTPLLERLADTGYANLRSEVEKTAGVLSNDLAKALDDAGDRSEAAANRAAVAWAPFQLKIQDTKAGITGLFATLAENPSRLLLGLGMAVGGEYGKQLGTDIKEKRDAERRQPTERAADLMGELEQAKSPERVQSIQTEANRRAGELYARAQNERDQSMVAALERAILAYAVLVARAREHGAEIVATNLALDQQRKEEDEITRAQEAIAVRERDARAWLLEKGIALQQQTAEHRRQLELAAMDPADRLARLESERADAAKSRVQVTDTHSEIQQKEILQELDLLEIDKQILETRKAVAEQTDKELQARIRLARLNGPNIASQKGDKDDDAAAVARGVDVASSMRMAELQAQAARDQASFKMTEEEKRAARQKNLEDQRRVLDESAGQLRAGGATERAQQFEDRSSSIGAEIAADQASRPETAMEGLEAGLTKIQDRWGTLSTQIRDGIMSIGDSITGSLTGGMQQLLGTTEMWTQKLGDIAGPIMGAITQSISKMFAEWIVARGAAAAKNILFSRAEGLVDAIAKAPGALMTSISSFGVAALVGTAAFVAAKALTGGFFEGGFTGVGDPHDPAGIVHRGEFVFPHDVVKAVGPDVLAGMVEQIRNPSHTFEMPAALAPHSLNIGGAGGASGSTSEDTIAMPRLLVVDHREREFIDRTLADPRFSTRVEYIGQGNPGDSV